MNNKCSTILTTILQPLLAMVLMASEPATLYFINGDILSGEIQRLEGDQFYFKSPMLREETTFNRDMLLDLKLTEEQLEAKPVNHTATITLEDRFGQKSERDQLQGQLVGINDDFLELATDYAGTLKIDRSLIYAIDISTDNYLLYSGPNSLEEWQVLGDPNSWSYSNNSLITGSGNSSLAKEFDTPSRSQLSFTIDRKENIDLALLLYADSSEPERPRNYYELSLNANYLNMRKYLEKGSSRPLNRGTPNVRAKLGERIRCDIYSDTRSGAFHIYIDGKNYANFSDLTPSPELMGKSLHLRSRRDYEMRIQNIKLFKWNGSLPQKLGTEEESELQKKNQLLLANGDALVGDLGKTHQDNIELTTEYTSYNVPLARVRSIQLAAKDENHPRADKYDLKAYFKSGGWIILDPILLTPSTLVGNHEAIGDITFDLNAFSHIEFNVYDKQLNKLRDEKW